MLNYNLKARNKKTKQLMNCEDNMLNTCKEHVKTLHDNKSTIQDNISLSKCCNKPVHIIPNGVICPIINGGCGEYLGEDEAFNKIRNQVVNLMNGRDLNHQHGGMEEETKCDCCGWDDNGYQHEPQCSSLKTETWRDRFADEARNHRFIKCEETNDGTFLEQPDYDYIEKFFQQELERIKNNFMKEFTDPDTNLINISKYDHEELINFFNKEIK